MFSVIGWVVFGLFVGLIAKALHPGEDPVGCLPTVGIGIAGSFLGGGIQWILNRGGVYGPAGFMWSVIGAVVLCFLYRQFRISRFVKAQGRKPSYIKKRK